MASEASAMRDGVPCLVAHLVDALNAEGIKYSHWKSNVRLWQALAGETDLDLLVSRSDSASFEGLVGRIGFREGVGPRWAAHPWLRHFYGLDRYRGVIVHLHVAYRLVTGGGLVKNYQFPIEQLLLDVERSHCAIAVPRVEAELVVFVIRKSVEQGTLAETLLLWREGSSVSDEARQLYDQADMPRALEVLREWFPSVREADFRAAVDALRNHGLTAPSFYLAARRIRRKLKRYRVVGGLFASASASSRLLRLVARKVAGRGQPLSPAKGGCIVAFVGSDGAGKTTLISDTKRWLGREFAVRTLHAGKPPATLLSAVPRLALPALRRLFPRERVINLTRRSPGSGEGTSGSSVPSLMSLVRSVLIAHDQVKHLRAGLRYASKGAVVLCDRYPSAVIGGMDGPRADSAAIPDRYWFRRWLANREGRLYSTVPTPDLVLFVRVPIELALERNRRRSISEGRDLETSIEERYGLVSRWQFPHANVHSLDGTRPISELILETRATVWSIF